MAWKRRSVIWLSGVRRAGKTQLCLSLPDIEYYDCELPRVRLLFEDPEGFLKAHRHQRIVLDEIHRLDNPSELLKIAADHYSDVKIIATGSSILSASSKFKDTLAGRKTEIWLTPLRWSENVTFGNASLAHRFLHGGLPPFFLSENLPELEFQEWLDAFWARDIQELFKLEKRFSFKKFFELILAQSGNIFEANRFAKPCEISRQTVNNYLSVLELTHVAHIIRPFNTHRATEIIAAPKVYGFDTGFVCFAKGWQSLRPEDSGFLWEHLVLSELQSHLQTKPIYYWRDKQQHEIDFVIPDRGGNKIDLIECKSSANNVDLKNISFFRKVYPEGKNYIVVPDLPESFVKKYEQQDIQFVTLAELIEQLR